MLAQWIKRKWWNLKPVRSLGTERVTETLESVSDAVWQCDGSSRGAQIDVLHSLVHRRGAGLLQHRRPQRTLKRQELPRSWEIRKFLQLSITLNMTRQRSDRFWVATAKITWLRWPRVLCWIKMDDFKKEGLLLSHCLIILHSIL